MMRWWLLGLVLVVACSTTSTPVDVGLGGEVVADAGPEVDVNSTDLDNSGMSDQESSDLSGLPETFVEERTGETDTFEEVADLDETVLWQPPFEPAMCGMEPYQWIDPASLGEVVAYEEFLLSKLTPESIDGLLAELDLEGVPPAKYGVRNFRFRYTTQDRGTIIEATGTIGIPWGDDVPWPAPVMLWLHGSAGFMDDCAPSRDSMLGAAPGTLWSAQGYVVVAPDYIGLLGIGESSPPGSIHPYLVGEATAIASLDSVRAVLNFLTGDEGLEGSADSQQVVIMGGSQGGHAALFAERYQPHYAPEFHVAGVVAATGPADLLGEGSFAMSTLVPGSSTFLFALVSMKNWYGHPEDLFDLFTNQEPYFIAEKIEGYMADACGGQIDTSEIDELSDVFLPDVITHSAAGNWEAIPPWGCYLEANSIPGTPVPRLLDTPILTVYSGDDELLNNDIEKANWSKICAEGYTLEYLECADLGHSAGAVASLPYAMKWLEARLNDLPLEPDIICQMQEPVDCTTL
jgi:hypothetical protein